MSRGFDWSFTKSNGAHVIAMALLPLFLSASCFGSVEQTGESIYESTLRPNAARDGRKSSICDHTLHKLSALERAFVNINCDIEIEHNLNYLTETASKGNGSANLILGDIYFGDYEYEKNFKKSMFFYSAALNIGKINERLYARLGTIYMDGLGGKKDLEKTKALFREAIIKFPSSGVSYYNYGIYFFNSENYKAANRNFEMAGKLGHLSGAYNLGISFYKGIGVKKNIEKSKVYFLEAARKGYVKAQYALSNIYEKENNTVASENEMLHWLAKAADSGYAPAQHKIGLYYVKHAISKENLDLALKYLQLAAEHGDFNAAYNLAEVYRTMFENMHEDSIKNNAIYWYQYADRHGNKKASEKLKKLLHEVN